MEWQFALLLIFGSLVVMMISGLPIAFGFMLVNLIGVFLFFGGTIGLEQLIFSMAASVTYFALLPLCLFVLMGEVLFHSGIGIKIIDALDKWLGRLPGRLGVLTVGGGALFSTLTGWSITTVAILGEGLVPEMERRGYKKSMSLGPILGSGGLAIMIPPSDMAILLGAIGRISIGRILIAIIVPGMLMAVLYAAYVIVRCRLQPSIAPSYKVPHVPLSEKLAVGARYILPVGVIVFLVIGVVFLGIATPTEAAATGAFGTFILAAAYKRMNWGIAKKSVNGTVQLAVMLLMIIVGATAFSQILAFSGATKGLVEVITNLSLHPILIIIGMQVIGIFLGMFMEQVSIMMITLPLFVPIILALGFSPVWFAVIFLLNMEMATTTPPFGLALFVMKGVAPSDTTMGDIYKAAFPFLGLDAIVMALLIVFPMIALWLPSIMR